MQLDIEADLYERLSRRAAQNDFDSAEEYSRVVLRTVTEELESETEDEAVEQRLEDLGYL